MTACLGIQYCVDFIGHAECHCPEGYLISDTGCDDIDECLDDGRCESLEVCKNTPGAYECVCAPGYERPMVVFGSGDSDVATSRSSESGSGQSLTYVSLEQHFDF